MKVYKYGASVRDPQVLEIINVQLAAATEYRRQLVEIELERRRAVADAESRFLPELGDLRRTLVSVEEFLEMPGDDEDKAAIGAARALVKDLTGKIRALERDVETEYTKGQVEWNAAMMSLGFAGIDSPGEMSEKQLSSAVGPRTREKIAARLEEVALSDESLPRLWREILVANRAASVATKAARGSKGCCSGTSLIVEESVNGAKRTPIGFGKHRRVDRLGVKLAPAVATRDVLVPGAFCEILPMLPGDRQTGRNRKPLRRFRLRLGARPEIWISGTFVYHRPLPEDGQIALVQLIRQSGRANGWSLQFTLATSAELRHIGSGPELGIAICWEDDGDDIVTAVDSSGCSYRIPGIVQRERFADSLMATADRLIDEGLPVLSELAEQSDATVRQWRDGVSVEVPARELVSTMGQRGARMVPLAVARSLTHGIEFGWWGRWKRERKERGLDLYANLAELAQWLGVGFRDARLPWVFVWLRKVDHLWRWYREQRKKNAGRRQQYATLNGNRIYEQSRAVVIDGRDLAITSRRGKGQRTNAVRHKGAPGAMRARLRQLYGDALVESVPPNNLNPAEVAVDLLTQYHEGALAPKKESKLSRMRQKKQRRSIIDDKPSSRARKVPVGDSK